MLQLISLFMFFLAGCSLQYVLFGINSACIAAMLSTIIFSALFISFPSEKNRFHTLAAVLYLLLSLCIPVMQPFVPLIALIIRCTDCRGLFLTCIPALLSSITFAQLQGRRAGGILLMLLAFAICINRLLTKLDDMHRQMILLRDAAKEQQLLVEEKNKALRESQNENIRLATLQERNRIAREIHDNVGHMLTRSILQIGAIKTINKDAALGVLLDGLHETLGTAMNNIRESVHDLHDESVDISFAIRDLLSTAAGFDTTLQIDPGIVLPKQIKYNFIAIVKEAVNNAVKYSDGNHICVTIHEHPAIYQLLIEDNGPPNTGTLKVTDAYTGSSEGIGLKNIEDRVKEMNGTVSISRECGFKIFISVFKQNVQH